jgi:hypothetical protein
VARTVATSGVDTYDTAGLGPFAGVIAERNAMLVQGHDALHMIVYGPATEQASKDHTIASIDSEGKIYRELHMPILDSVARKPKAD